jgi:hypothetical protein
LQGLLGFPAEPGRLKERKKDGFLYMCSENSLVSDAGNFRRLSGSGIAQIMSLQPSTPSVGAPTEYEVPEDVLTRTVERLSLCTGDVEAKVRKRLHEIARGYLIDRSGPAMRTAAAEKKAIGKVARHLEMALIELMGLAPEYVAAVDTMMGELDIDAPADVRNSVARAYFATSKFLDMFQPVGGRDPDLPLREAVQALIKLFAELGLEPTSVRMNKANGRSPELKSTTAQAMGDLLIGVNPKLTKTSIVNMIEDVRKNPDKDDDLMRLVRLHPELDLCLRPGRDDPEVRREFFWDEWDAVREQAQRTKKSAEKN